MSLLHSREEKRLFNYFPNNKIPDFLNKEGIFIAGGALTSIFTGGDINDIDVYFRDRDVMKDTILEIYQMVYRPRVTPVYVTPNAISLQFGDAKIQLIIFDTFETPCDIFETFDFSVNMASYNIHSGEFMFSSDFMKTLASRVIKINHRTAYPIASLCRMKKYRDKGFVFTRNSIIKLGMACSKFNIVTWDEFEKQIGGVYGMKLKDGVKDGYFILENAIETLDQLFTENTQRYFSLEDVNRITGLNIVDIGVVSSPASVSQPPRPPQQGRIVHSSGRFA